MVQGTTSDAGKTTLVAGLCRALARRGVAVAPFKPQNMALNSAVTVDGGEIGRAQALQAQACYLKAHSDMNPVLLKPESDTGAQVILHGQVFRPMDAEQFHDYKKVAMEAVMSSWQRLCSRYAALIVEGAGSPAEINLRENDIANMGFAERADCPVILVADIDKGGVFAHLVGTLALLSESEQARVVGFVINKFRGDLALLQPGLDWLEARTGKPVLAVLPYLQGLYLDAEDAINSFQCAGENAIGRSGDTPRRFKVVVPVFSRISNHTDFDALRLHPQVDLEFIGPQSPLPAADLIILPGTKSVRADLALLRSNGWQEAIAKHLRYGGRLIGICGGFQMLGKSIADPQGIEGRAGNSSGLGWLDIDTLLVPHKQLGEASGQLATTLLASSSCDDSSRDDSDDSLNPPVPVSGYEIHCGVSRGPGLARPALILAEGRHDGAVSADGQMFGTYLHGLFDGPEACAALLQWAGFQLERGEAAAVDIAQRREQDLERLADCLEQELDIAALFPALQLAPRAGEQQADAFVALNEAN